MNPKLLIHLLLGCLITGALAIGCSGEDEDPVGGRDHEVIVQAVTTPPNTADIVNDPVWEGVDVASIVVGEDSTYTDYFGTGVVRVQAIQDGEYVYMRFNWSDSSKTDQPGRWIWEIPGQSAAFSQKLDTVKNKFGNFALTGEERNRQLWVNEDVLSIFFEVGNGSVKANCALTCHTADTDTTKRPHYTQGNGNIDCWVWRAGRTEPLGIAEDYFWRDDGRFDAFSRPLYGRNSRDTTIDINTDPRLMHTTGRNYTGNLLFDVDTTTLLLFGEGWTAQDGVPGYIHFSNFNEGASSRYDVKAKAEYDPQLGRWNLVLWRTLVAPHSEDDVTFEIGQSYEATLAVMKSTALRHSGSQPFTMKF